MGKICDDIFFAREHGTDALVSFLYYLYNVDEAKIIKFIMAIAEQEKSVEFLDFKIKCAEGALSVDVCTKLTNSFTYVKPSTCYTSKNINNVRRGYAIQIRRICDTDYNFKYRANEGKQYLIA